jgi:hypothetical protein
VARAVYLHVGTAKSGTTYLQRMMADNRELLRQHGYLYPGPRSSHFMESLSLRGVRFKGHSYPAAEGAWERTAEEVRNFPGQALISHETLGNAMPKAIRRAVDSFPGSDVRVIITCRDLGRQIPAAFQERVKNGNPQAYAEYLSRMFETWKGAGSSGKLFWRTQNIAELGRRWSELVGEENVWLVTVPKPGAAPGELWRRFAEAAEMPTVDYLVSEGARNTSLGTVETELLRRLNGYFPSDLPWLRYQRAVKRRLVKNDLAPSQLGGRLSVPEQYQKVTDEVADSMIGAVRDRAFVVVGDLEELRPAFRTDATQPDELPADQLLDLSLRILSRKVFLKPRRRPASRHLSGREALRVLRSAARRRVSGLRGSR